MNRKLKLAVLLSGGGRTLENLVGEIRKGTLAAEIGVVVASNPKVYGIERAKKLGLAVQVVDRKAYGDTKAFSQAIWEVVRKCGGGCGAELVCLAGFLSLLEIAEDYKDKVINIHPAILPAFGGRGMYGHYVHEAVLAAGCKVSGCTVHFCNNEYDSGAILVQRCCEVKEDDTPESLAARVFEEECKAYPQAIRLIAEGRVTVNERRAVIRD